MNEICYSRLLVFLLRWKMQNFSHVSSFGTQPRTSPRPLPWTCDAAQTQTGEIGFLSIGRKSGAVAGEVEAHGRGMLLYDVGLVGGPTLARLRPLIKALHPGGAGMSLLKPLRKKAPQLVEVQQEVSEVNWGLETSADVAVYVQLLVRRRRYIKPDLWWHKLTIGRWPSLTAALFITVLIMAIDCQSDDEPRVCWMLRRNFSLSRADRVRLRNPGLITN